MIKITFPDNNSKQYQIGITIAEIAKDISISLYKSAIAAKLNDEFKDLDTKINENSKLEIITMKSDEALEIIRHDAAHILAQAVKELYPNAQITIGPVIEDGFYYDIAYEKSFTLDDLAIIEKRMGEIVKKNIPIIREIWNRNEAIEFFKSIGEFYKAEIIADIPENEQISLYRQSDFIDLCRGPHSPNTSFLKAFKLTKLAGAYWRGDSKNPMLQRIYGTAWRTKEELDAYLFRIEEAEKRDHRKIGKEIGLFHLQEEASGMVFWHHKGYVIFKILQDYIRNKLKKHNYLEVKTPIIVDRSLWEKSGHWEKFANGMFTTQNDEHIKALKPMNCPCHVQIFNQGMKSYRDLPIRMAEFGTCHRNEPSGSLHGIMRVREFIQDDAHIFCTPSDITNETIIFCELLQEVYRDFGFEEVKVKFSDRPEIRAGTNEVWDKAELALKEAVIATNLPFTINKGEGAFYGPKLEFVLRDAIGRDWQCGTLQVDFVLPERLDANYIDADGRKKHPVMLHRAIFGSIERFIGILIEEYKGKFPLWLAPIQISLLSVTEKADNYIEKIKNILHEKDFRVDVDITNEKINYKIRKHSLQKIPIICIIGAKEAEQGLISVRESPESQTVFTLEEFLDYLNNALKIPY